MDPNLKELVAVEIPDINPRVAKGIAHSQLRAAEAYIDSSWRCAAADFPPGLKYEGYERCSPMEEFRETTRPRDSKEYYELSRSDFYMVKYRFSYEGEELFPRYIYLPFVDLGGLIHIRGNLFVIHPILADPGYSLTSSSMFIQLTRTRLNFERTNHRFYVDGEQESVYVVWSWIHKEVQERHGRKGRRSRVTYSTLAHYLFAMEGFSQVMEKYAGAQVEVGTSEYITPKNFPKEDWVICGSVGIKPRAWMVGDYTPTDVRVAVPRNQFSSTVNNLLGSFYYIVDHFPDRIITKYIDEPYIWKVTLAHVISGFGKSEGLMVAELEEHFRSLDEYIDALVIKELSSSGVNITNIQELFIFVVETLSQKIITSMSEMSSIYNKRLTTLRYVLFDLIKDINTLMYRLKGANKKRGYLEVKEVNDIMNKSLRSNRIDQLRNAEKHPEVTTASVACDNMFFGITSVMITQDNASGGRSRKNTLNLRDPSKHLHVSIAEIGSFSTLTKSDPTGRSRINPFLHTDELFSVCRSERHRNLLDKIQLRINR